MSDEPTSYQRASLMEAEAKLLRAKADQARAENGYGTELSAESAAQQRVKDQSHELAMARVTAVRRAVLTPMVLGWILILVEMLR